jgi:hypothetical protein
VASGIPKAAKANSAPAGALGLTSRERTVVVGVLIVVACLIVGYWVAWFGDRQLVAAEHLRRYDQFEDAFPLADGWIVLCALAGARSLARASQMALFWLLAGGGAGTYLFCMDFLYDMEHGIWAKGSGGAIEAAINLLTLFVSLGLLSWTWRHRRVL